MQTKQFRVLLPLVQCPLAALFGGVGLWQRSAILSRPGFGEGQTLWDSTARFHVWPWPFKLAVVTNLPAFLSWALLGWPIGERWPEIPEGMMYAPALFFVAILWYGMGAWMDRRWGRTGTPASDAMTPWILLALFTSLCVTAVFARVQFATSDYLVLGAVIWLAIGLGVAAVTIFRKVGAGHR